MTHFHHRGCPQTGMTFLGLPRNVQGLGLLEALIAMAVASVALGALYRVVGQGVKSAAETELRVQAALVARSVLAGSAFADDFVKNNEGNFGAWKWRAEVTRSQIQFHPVMGNEETRHSVMAVVAVRVSSVNSGFRTYTLLGWKTFRDFH